MMITQLYAVYDSAAKTYGQPFCAQNRQIAVRSFRMLVNDESSLVNKSPLDFALYQVGTFNDETADITSTQPELVAHAVSLKDDA